jgi:hypothetical protein
MIIYRLRDTCGLMFCYRTSTGIPVRFRSSVAKMSLAMSSACGRPRSSDLSVQEHDVLSHDEADSSFCAKNATNRTGRRPVA